MPLSEKEKGQLQTAFYRGPLSLIEDEGLSPEEARSFFEREDVRAHAEQLKREFDQHDLLKARAKFSARRQLHALIDPAMAVLTMALGGPQYVRDKKTNNVMRDSRGHPLLVNPEPTNTQMRAVDHVLQGAGLQDFRIVTDPGADNAVERLFRRVEDEPKVLDTAPLGATRQEQTLALERVRVAIDRISVRLPEMREAFQAEFRKELDVAGSKRRGAATRAKRSKRKAAKKKARKRSARRGKAEG